MSIMALISGITRQSFVLLSDGSGVQPEKLPLSWQLAHQTASIITTCTFQPPIPRDRLVRHYRYFRFHLTSPILPKPPHCVERDAVPGFPLQPRTPFPPRFVLSGPKSKSKPCARRRPCNVCLNGHSVHTSGGFNSLCSYANTARTEHHSH
ncbi:unnamed protein product [Tuber aestivum]|uniref:Uncharacterized protein n=1 Tax=Tuber aestivum TaxID=59557 RepID=A0A292Q1C8_9PEZI|nr:unnamed protein product [Tuber aestivum]